MMNKKKSSSAGMIKYALFVPLFAALLFVNNLQAQGDAKEKILSQPKVQKQESQPPIVSTPDGKEVFKKVDEMPRFPGGDKGMMEYISQNIKYPVEAQNQGIQGMVVVRFVVNKTGEISDVTVLRSLTSTCDTEAVRVVKAMPKWTPGKQGGKAVDVYYTLPIQYRLQASDNNVENKKTPEIPDDVVFIVDGKTVSREEAMAITPDKIKSMNVIKDKSNPDKGTVEITLKKE